MKNIYEFLVVVLRCKKFENFFSYKGEWWVEVFQISSFGIIESVSRSKSKSQRASITHLDPTWVFKLTPGDIHDLYEKELSRSIAKGWTPLDQNKLRNFFYQAVQNSTPNNLKPSDLLEIVNKKIINEELDEDIGILFQEGFLFFLEKKNKIG